MAARLRMPTGSIVTINDDGTFAGAQGVDHDFVKDIIQNMEPEGSWATRSSGWAHAIVETYGGEVLQEDVTDSIPGRIY